MLAYYLLLVLASLVQSYDWGEDYEVHEAADGEESNRLVQARHDKLVVDHRTDLEAYLQTRNLSLADNLSDVEIPEQYLSKRVAVSAWYRPNYDGDCMGREPGKYGEHDHHEDVECSTRTQYTVMCIQNNPRSVLFEKLPETFNCAENHFCETVWANTTILATEENEFEFPGHRKENICITAQQKTASIVTKVRKAIFTSVWFRSPPGARRFFGLLTLEGNIRQCDLWLWMKYLHAKRPVGVTHTAGLKKIPKWTSATLNQYALAMNFDDDNYWFQQQVDFFGWHYYHTFVTASFGWQ